VSNGDPFLAVEVNLASTASPVAGTVLGPVAARSSLICLVGSNLLLSAGASTAVTDSAGNVYSKAAEADAGATPQASWWICDGQTGGPGGGPTAPLPIGATVTAAWAGANTTRTLFVVAVPDSTIEAQSPSPYAAGGQTSTTALANLAPLTATAALVQLAQLGSAASAGSADVPAVLLNSAWGPTGRPVPAAAWMRSASLAAQGIIIRWTGGSPTRAMAFSVAYVAPPAPPSGGELPAFVRSGNQWVALSMPRSEVWSAGAWHKLRG
jgi:hypothetical protein